MVNSLTFVRWRVFIVISLVLLILVLLFSSILPNDLRRNEMDTVKLEYSKMPLSNEFNGVKTDEEVNANEVKKVEEVNVNEVKKLEEVNVNEVKNVGDAKDIHEMKEIKEINTVTKNEGIAKTPNCKNWIVISANHIPTKAVSKYTSIVKQSDWCCVSVLRKNSIKKEFEVMNRGAKFVLLSLSEQANFMTMVMPDSNLTPNQKSSLIQNIGYLYAIAHGAQVIYDTSEFSHLIEPSIKLFEQVSDYVLVAKSDNLLKSYTDFLNTAPSFLWRYGYTQPLTWMEDYHFVKEMNYDCPDFKKENVKIIQLFYDEKTEVAKAELADVRVNFALSRGTFAVYNGVSVLHDYTAFFGLFRSDKLQSNTVDVLRSLYTQRLLCDLGYNVAFAHARIVPRDDASVEDHSRELQNTVVEFLLSWRSDASTLVERMVELANKFYERGFWSEDEAYNIQVWIVALAKAGYAFPPITRNDGCSSQIEPCELAKHHSNDAHKADSNDVSLQWLIRMTNVPEGKWPLGEFYKQIFIHSLKFFWHQEKNPISLVVIFDAEKEGDHTFGEEIQNEYPFPEVFYEEDEKCYGNKKTYRMQWSMFWSDKYTTKEYVGFVDTDSIFVSLVTDRMLFQDGKPRVHGFYGTCVNTWNLQWKKATRVFLGFKQTIHAMNYFPVIIKTKHLVELREYIENIHGSPFNEVFKKLAIETNMSQFNIMMTYCWYFHRDEYVWHLEESQTILPEDDEPTSFTGITEEMKVPFPKLVSHYKYFRPTMNVAEGWNILGGLSGIDPTSLKTRNKVMREGYCFSGGFSLTPDKCADFNQSEVFIALFEFSAHSWLWDDRCLASQIEHYSNTLDIKHEWDLSLLT